jgi:carboxypeptidase family protein/TonB-dependent receptor-like protein
VGQRVNRSRAAVLLCAAVYLLVLPALASSQVLRGIVFAEDRGTPIAGATVVLLTPDLVPVDSIRTGIVGSFAVPLTAGRYFVAVSHPEWVSSAPQVFDIADAQELDVTIGLRVAEGTVDVVVSPNPGPSSYLRGRILDGTSGRPVISAEVELLELGWTRLTGQDGRFRFGDVPARQLSLRIEALGYATTEVPLRAEAGIAHHVSVPIADAPIAVEGVTVTTRSRVSAWVLEPAYERMSRGLGGQFLGPEELESKGPIPIADALQGMLSVEVPGSRFHRTISVRRCAPALYYDGVRVGRPGDDVSEFLAINSREMEIIEVYSGPATLPPEFAAGAMCAVALWSRR